MKYTLAENAVSSLSIAIDNFKKFFYNGDDLLESIEDEYIKICAVFLENSIELMIKSILASIDPLSIYIEPNSRKIRDAQSRVTSSKKLEDILISEGAFKTITYSTAVQEYANKFHNTSEKVQTVLFELSNIRNSLTHFGIDRTDNKGELIISILCTFDIIYNYLYPELIKLDGVKKYFTSDDMFVHTIHVEKFLLDENNQYNNILDFLDETLEIGQAYICQLRAENVNSKIHESIELFILLFYDKKIIRMCKHYNIDFNTVRNEYAKNKYFIEINPEGDDTDPYWLFSKYSPFYNSTIFIDEGGLVYFIIVHNEGNIYLYNKEKQLFWKSFGGSEMETENIWVDDHDYGNCEKMNLSKRNLLKTFEFVFEAFNKLII